MAHSLRYNNKEVKATGACLFLLLCDYSNEEESNGHSCSFSFLSYAVQNTRRGKSVSHFYCVTHLL